MHFNKVEKAIAALVVITVVYFIWQELRTPWV